MTLQFHGPSDVQTTLSLERGAPGCHAVSNGTQCSIDRMLPAGSYVAAIATFDQVTCSGGACSIPPAARELSANQNVPFKILAGKIVRIGLVLDAVPARVDLRPLAGSLSGSMAAGFTLDKCFASGQVEVLAADADGNLIVGAGAPVPSLVSSDPAHLAVASPTPKQPQTFTLRGAFSAGTPSASAVPSPSSTIALTVEEKPLHASGAKPVAQKAKITFDRNICGIVTSFVDHQTIASYPDLTGITAGPDGALWFAEDNATAGGVAVVGKITTTGAFSEYSLGAGTGTGHPTEVLSKNGSLWFARNGVGSVSRVTASGTPTTFSKGLSLNASLWGIAKGADGNIWFANCAGGTVGKMTTGGSFTEYSSGLTAQARPLSITPGPDGNLWFTEYGAGKIGRVSTGGTIAEFSLGLASGAIPSHIVAGPDGRLWFTDVAGRVGAISVNGSITEYSDGIPSTSAPASIAVGPDGNLWFAEGGSGSIAKIATTGSVTQYPLGKDPLTGNAASPYGITTGPDGNLWVTEGGYGPAQPVIFRVQ